MVKKLALTVVVFITALTVTAASSATTNPSVVSSGGLFACDLGVGFCVITTPEFEADFLSCTGDLLTGPFRCTSQPGSVTASFSANRTVVYPNAQCVEVSDHGEVLVYSAPGVIIQRQNGTDVTLSAICEKNQL